MRFASELLLTYLLHACWQLILVAAAAALCGWLLRGARMRFQHLFWVSVLIISLFLPLWTSVYVLNDFSVLQKPPQQEQSTVISPVPTGLPPLEQSNALAPIPASPSPVRIGAPLAAILFALYILFLAVRSIALLRACQRTRAIKREAYPVEPDDNLRAIVDQCQRAFPAARPSLLCSDSIPMPVAVGFRKPLVILPGALLREADPDLLASAIGHEMAHVERRDYLLNLICEFLYLPISFHPAASMVRRRIKQTRELCCDELVADRLLKAFVYARSLLRLASLAPPLRKLATTTTVGIADADILEVRVMSLLKQSKTSRRGKKLILIAVPMILAASCVTATAFAFRFDFSPLTINFGQQQQAEQDEREAKERAEHKALEEKLRGEKAGLENREVPEQMEREALAKMEAEREVIARRQAEMASMAKISMDQAIQIANGQVPGKVLECRLIRDRFEPADGAPPKEKVAFAVTILTVEGTNTATILVLVDAVDGSVIKTGRERNN